MISNYLKVALRNILKHKTFSLINIIGLAAAMSVCMLIMLMLADQKSYDRFNVNRDRIYRILCEKPEFRHPYATSPFPLAAVLKEEDPVVGEATHLVMGVGGDAVYNRSASELRGYFADTTFFRVFSFELAEGSPESALSAPNSMVLSAEAAHRLFKQEDPIGKTVTFSDRGLNFLGQGEASTSTPWGSFIITGVLADKKYKSHLTFDVLVSSSTMDGLIATNKLGELRGDWTNFFKCFTYALIQPGKTSAELDSSLGGVAGPHIKGLADLKDFHMRGQVLTSISPGILLGNEPSITLPRVVYYFLSLLALVIMISACLNYTNLSIARSLTRAREIGVRKVNGAPRSSIVFQFLCESILTSLFALLVAVGLLFFMKAGFRGLWINQYLHFDLDSGPWVYLVFTGFAVLIGVISGLYPAFYLSGFQLINVLRNFGTLRPGKLVVRKVLSVTQFAVSLVFVISSILIFNQSTHFLRFKYEFTTKNIVNIPLQGNDYRAVTRGLSAVPGVEGVSACEYIPVTGRSEGGRFKKPGSKEDYTAVTALRIDENFVGNLQLPLIAGKNLPSGPHADHYLLLNLAATKALGYKTPYAALGQSLVAQGNDTAYLEVVGVLGNFHLSLDQTDIQPLVMQNMPGLFRFVNVRIASTDPRTTVSALERKWKTLDPVHSFKYQFFDDQLAATSQGFFDAVTILGFMAVVAIIIACLGMLGMATYTTERRVKEVGIRKTLGARVSELVLLLSGEFLWVLLIAILIAAPLSFLLNSLWLNKFPNRVGFGLGTILVGVLILLLPGLAAILSQTIRVARRNPVIALRTE